MRKFREEREGKEGVKARAIERKRKMLAKKEKYGKILEGGGSL